MQKSITRLFMLLSFMATMASCSKENLEEEVKAYDQVATRSVTYDYTDVELEILDRINTYRTEKGFQILEPLAEASVEAEEHTDYMIEVGEVSHDNFPERYNALVGIVNAKAVSENVAYGYRTADAVVRAWINSDAHRENLEADFTHFGISVKNDSEGKNYFTNIFVKK